MAKFVRIMTLLLLGLASTQAVAQHLSHYSVSTGVDASCWMALSSPDTLLRPAQGDFAVSSVRPIGFSFPFAEESYDHFSVNADGNLRLGPTPTGSSGHTLPFSSYNCTFNSPKVNAMGFDAYVTDSGYVCCQLLQDSLGAQVLVVEYALSTYAMASRQQVLRAQVQLFSDGAIRLVYAPESVALLPACSRQPGLCVGSADGWVVASDSTAVSFANGSQLSIPQGSWFTPGRYFAFARPTHICGRIESLAFEQLGATSAQVVVTADSAASAWRLRYATSLSQLNSAMARSMVIDTTRFTLDSLAPHTIYFVAVSTVCDSLESSSVVGSFSTLHAVDPVASTSVRSLRPSAVALAWRCDSTHSVARPDDFEVVLSSTDSTIAAAHYSVQRPDTVLAALRPATTYRCSVAARQGSWLSDPATLTFVTPDSSCAAPLVVAAEPTPNAVALSWVPGCDEESWQVEWQDLSDTLWTVVDSNVAATTYLVSGLIGEASYRFRVGARCGNAIFYDSVVAAVPSCAPASSFHVATLSSDAALLRWAPASSVIVEYGESGFVPGQGTQLRLDADSCQLASLEQCTHYDAYLYTLCTVGDTTRASHLQFVTQCLCPAVSSLAVTQSTSSTLTLDWQVADSGQQCRIEYGPVGFDVDRRRVAYAAAPFTLDGLASGTAYEISVAPVCDTMLGIAHSIVATTTACDNPWSFVIGDSVLSGTTSLAPVCNGRNYSMTEMIVLQSEFDGISTIQALDFYYEDVLPLMGKDSVEIYLMTTLLDHFDSVGQFQPVLLPLTCVYSGALSFTQGWNTIPFGFDYTLRNDRNLMVVFVDYSNGYDGASHNFRQRATAQPMTWAYSSDYTSPSLWSYSTDRSNVSLLSYRPEMRFVSCLPTCSEPYNLHDSVDFESALVSWHGHSDTYRISCKTLYDESWPDYQTVSGNSCLIRGLRAGTHYVYRVCQVCDSLSVSDWAEATFVTDTLPCQRPMHLRAAIVTPSMAVLEWQGDLLEQEQSWSVNLFNADTNITIVAHEPGLVVDQLLPNTEYFAAVRYYCSAGIYTPWSDTIAFTTSSCKNVKDFSVSEVTDSSAVLSWRSGGNATVWQLQYGDVEAESDTSVILFRLSYQLDNLVADHCYRAKVRSVCDDGIVSDWSDEIQFRASNLGIASLSEARLCLYPNPTHSQARLAIEAVGDVRIAIYNINGQQVFESAHVATEGAPLVVDTPLLPKGSYLVKVVTSSGVAVRKLLVQ